MASRIQSRESLAAFAFAAGCLGSVVVVAAEGTDGLLGAFLAIAAGWLLAERAVAPPTPRGPGASTWRIS